jgi:2-polyprenyl-6-hydroxyphenyl methylase/3-demethylubiquinone-9 3-methyltransferase
LAQFDFGENWSDFSAAALDAGKVEQAKEDFAKLIAPIGGLQGKSFLDIGFGQGLSLLAAAAAGADVLGIDINPKCAEVLARNRRYFPVLDNNAIPVFVGSILDEVIVDRARQAGAGGGGYDVVHSWGALHHTGNMKRALHNAASLVMPGGYLVVALYNRHWTSGIWGLIKWAYCSGPWFLKRLLILALYPVIYAAKWLVTGSDTRRMARGMDFYYDVVDWVGGYPYEYASKAEVIAMLKPIGLRCVTFVPCRVPTGCNEFVFERSR